MITRYRLSTLALRIFFVLLPGPVFAAELTLSVSGIPSASGKLMVAVLDSEAALDGKRAPGALADPATPDRPNNLHHRRATGWNLWRSGDAR